MWSNHTLHSLGHLENWLWEEWKNFGLETLAQSIVHCHFIEPIIGDKQSQCVERSIWNWSLTEGIWALANNWEKSGRVAEAIKCLEANCQNQVSFLPITDTETRLRVAALLMCNRSNITHPKSHHERAQLIGLIDGKVHWENQVEFNILSSFRSSRQTRGEMKLSSLQRHNSYNKVQMNWSHLV